jgi:hypothetical protein
MGLIGDRRLMAPQSKMTSRRSQIAHHKDRAAIETGLARAVPLRKLEKRYGVSLDSLYRYRVKMRKEQPQIFAALVAADWKVKPEELEALRLETSDGWLKQLRAQFDKLVRAQDLCLEEGNFPIAAQLASQVHRALEMLGRAIGEIATHSLKIEQNIILAPGYWRIRTAIVMALASHPKARRAVLAALHRVETDDGGNATPTLTLPAIAEPVTGREDRADV